MSTLYVDTINEKTSGNGIYIPGHVVQVVVGELKTRSTISSQSATATGLKATITPKSTSSKILVRVDSGWGMNNLNLAIFKLFRNSTHVNMDPTYLDAWQTFQNQLQGLSSAAPTGLYIPLNLNFLDSPASTSALEYELYVQCDSASPTIYVNGRPQSDHPGIGTMTLMEIAQ